MGLIENRAVNAYREHVFPRWKERLEAFLGYPIEIEVEWSELTSPGFGDWYFQYLTEIYFLPLQYALQQVAFDDLGRKTLQDHLKSISIRNRNDNSNSMTMVSFDDGRLVIDHLPHANCAEIASRTVAIRDCLERNL
jgi:hypothetical protein